MAFKSFIGATCACLAVVSFSANSALIGRLAVTPGGTDYQAYYDTNTNLTWLADANYAQTSGYDTDGLMSWTDADAWATALEVAGVGGWRLPDTIDVDNDGTTQGVDAGYNITTHSELSNMFYNVLGNSAYFHPDGYFTECYVAPDYCLSNTGPFSNLQPFNYWSMEYAPNPSYYAWAFQMGSGNQGNRFKGSTGYAWAVQTGDIGAVPIPAAVWLFGSGLVGLIGVARRKKV